jgi:protein N-terminal glutamine amidohydrolase
MVQHGSIMNHAQASTSPCLEPLPPAVPGSAVYTKQYCEENIYLLAETFSRDSAVEETWDIFAVFISNDTRTVALRNQKLAREENGVVVWDYHVVLVLRLKGAELRMNEVEGFFAHDTLDEEAEKTKDGASSPRAWVYDFDTKIERFPCPLQGLHS